MLISNKANFKPKLVRRDKEDHNKLIKGMAGFQWLMSIIIATWGGEFRRIMV
jgi:hypothetical protein